MLVASKLNKHFEGVSALEDVSVELRPGKVTGIIGPNGSGKTTLVNLLTGMVPMDAGTVAVCGCELEEIHRQKVLSYGLSRTFQSIRLIEQVSVMDNLLLALQPRGLARSMFGNLEKECSKSAEEILKKIDLVQKKDELAMNLSYGQRKLLEIGRVLALGTQVMLFDEPFAGLFPEIVEQVVGILQELRSQGKTIGFIEHNMELVRRISDHVLFLDEGKLIAQGAPEEVFALPEVLDAYLGE